MVIQDFGRQLLDLEPFFSSVAQVGGALLGLVFVALTFNPRTLGLRHDPAMRNLAQQVFSDFLTVMVVSLILLLPQDTARTIGVVVAVIALAGLTRIARNGFTVLHEKHALRLQLLQRFWLSLLGYAGLLAGAVLLFRGAQSSSGWAFLEASPILLLIAGARSAWLLVMQNAE